MLQHFDQPFADTSAIPMYWVSAAVRERGIVCALSGDGGDEAFGGYPRFWRVNHLLKLMDLPEWLRHAAHQAGHTLAGSTRNWGRRLAKVIELAEAGRTNTASLLERLTTYLSEDQKAELMEPAAFEGLAPSWRLFDGYRPMAVTDREEISRRMTETLFAVSLPSDMLRKVDMMSMRASIEVRVPMLDEDIVDLGLTLPHRLKTNGRSGKLVLRRLAQRWLPAEVARHPKHGFSIPLDVMAPPAFHAVLEELLCSGDSRTGQFINRQLVRGWLTAFAAPGPGQGGAISRSGLYQRIMMLLSLELWLRRYQLSW